MDSSNFPSSSEAAQTRVIDPIPGVVYPDAERLSGYLARGDITRETLIGEFRTALRRHADKTAIAGAGWQVSYRELDELSDQAALGFARLGLKPLDRVAFQVNNSRNLVVAVLGCLKANLVPLCTLHSHRRVEMVGLGGHAEIRAHFFDTTDRRFDLLAFSFEIGREIPSLAVRVVVNGEAQEGAVSLDALIASTDAGEARAFVETTAKAVDPFQVVFFQISGGSTGVPKIIPRFQNDYVANIRAVIKATSLSENDRVLAPGPMLHNAGFSCFWAPALLAGAAVLVPKSLDQRDLEALFRACRPTWMYMPKPLLPRIAAVLQVVPEVRATFRGLVTSGGGAIVEKECGVPVMQFFGMTEGLISFSRPEESDARRHGGVGWPIAPADEARILAVGSEKELPIGAIGEMVIRGPYTLHGYYRAPEQNRTSFTSDGWLRTGDLVRIVMIEDKPILVYEGRLKDLINRGGEKIACEEVERYARLHPAIHDIAVVPAPCPIFGERGFAFVIGTKNTDRLTVETLGVHLNKEGLAKFKWPEHLAYLDEFPNTAAGKLNRQKLRDEAARLLRDQSSMEVQMANLALAGVHHTARPTWRLADTVAFYRDVMGLKLVHAITARGWGREGHPDFLHFFFDSGRGSTIAFFYYLGTERPEYLEPRPDHNYRSTHTAWQVETEEELLGWKAHLEEKGIEVSPLTNHEVIDSIYFHDPNGYNIEITTQKRSFVPADSLDAELTLLAAISLEQQGKTLIKGSDIDAVWRAKAKLVEGLA